MTATIKPHTHLSAPTASLALHPAPGVDIAYYRHPSCDIPAYAGFETAYTLAQGGMSLSRVDDLANLNSSPYLARNPSPGLTLVEHVLAPAVGGHGGPRAAIRAPWPGGTWRGACGAMLWVPDTDGSVMDGYRVMYALTGTPDLPQTSHHNDIARASQAQLLHRTSNSKQAGHDGFYYECQRPMRHLGPCGGSDHDGNPDALAITWDPALGALAPAVQPALF